MWPGRQHKQTPSATLFIIQALLLASLFGGRRCGRVRSLLVADQKSCRASANCGCPLEASRRERAGADARRDRAAADNDEKRAAAGGNRTSARSRALLLHAPAVDVARPVDTSSATGGGGAVLTTAESDVIAIRLTIDGDDDDVNVCACVCAIGESDAPAAALEGGRCGWTTAKRRVAAV